MNDNKPPYELRDVPLALALTLVMYCVALILWSCL